MIVYVCDCGCFHGWKEDDAKIVKLVTNHSRGSQEDIWKCPGCHREHRTHDGSMMGQLHKAWRYATKEELAFIEKGVDPRINNERGRRVEIDENGDVRHICDFR